MLEATITQQNKIILVNGKIYSLDCQHMKNLILSPIEDFKIMSG
jgi:hypothetical protein